MATACPFEGRGGAGRGGAGGGLVGGRDQRQECEGEGEGANNHGPQPLLNACLPLAYCTQRHSAALPPSIRAPSNERAAPLSTRMGDEWDTEGIPTNLLGCALAVDARYPLVQWAVGAREVWNLDRGSYPSRDRSLGTSITCMLGGRAGGGGGDVRARDRVRQAAGGASLFCDPSSAAPSGMRSWWRWRATCMMYFVRP